MSIKMTRLISFIYFSLLLIMITACNRGNQSFSNNCNQTNQGLKHLNQVEFERIVSLSYDTLINNYFPLFNCTVSKIIDTSITVFNENGSIRKKYYYTYIRGISSNYLAGTSLWIKVYGDSSNQISDLQQKIDNEFSADTKLDRQVKTLKIGNSVLYVFHIQKDLDAGPFYLNYIVNLIQAVYIRLLVI